MAFKSTVTVDIGTTKETIFTAGANTTATLIGLSLSNKHTQSVQVDIFLYKDSSTTEASLITAGVIAVGGSLMVVGGDQKIVMEAGDEIRVVSDTATSVDSVLSYLESEL